MDKLNKVLPIVKPPEPFEKEPEASATTSLTSEQTVGNSNLQAPEVSEIDTSLKERILAIQEAKKNLSIESQAAMDLGSLISGIRTAIDLGQITKFIINNFPDFSKETVHGQELTDNAIQSLGPYWNIDLLSRNSTAKEKAIQNITEGSLKNPQQITKEVELVLRELIVHSRDLTDENLNGIRLTLRGLFSALEGLYQRTDVEVLRSINKREYGWNYYTKPHTGIAKALADNLFSPPKMTKELDEYVGIANLTQETGWYREDVLGVFVSLLEKSHNFPTIDEESKSSMRRILVRNWKFPVQVCKIPEIQRSNDYRLSMYREILATLVEENPFGRKLTPDDSLFLRTSIEMVPAHLRLKAYELRKELVDALKDELDEHKHHPHNYSPRVDTIKSILQEATSIPREDWDTEAAKLTKIKEQNDLKFVEFKNWTGTLCQMSEADLRKCFDSLTQERMDNVSLSNKGNILKTLISGNKFDSQEDLNSKLDAALRFMKLDSEVQGEKLTQNNAEMGLFFFTYLNTLLEKKVKVGNDKPVVFKNYLNQENKDSLLEVSKRIAHDKTSFKQARDIEFFTNPSTASVPGQALALHHKLTYCFNEEGYVDNVGLKDLVLPNAVDILSNTAKQRGFILSGPPEANKLLFAKALANQLGIGLFEINKDSVHSKKSDSITGFDVTIKLPNGKTGTIENFVDFAMANNPCVVFFGDADKLLVPRKEDQGRDKSKPPTPEEENLTGAFLYNLDKLHNEAPRVILIMATDKPPAEEIDTALLDKSGYSDEAKQTLFRYVSFGAIRGGRVDQKSFLLHKIREQPIKAKDEEVDQARLDYMKDRTSRLEESGKKKLIGDFDFIKITKTSEGLTPKQIKKALEELTPFELTQENIIAAFEQVRKSTS